MSKPTKGTITIENLEPRMTVYNLAHPDFVRTRKIPQVQELKGGKSVGVFVKKRIPTSITFLARERKSCLPNSILRCPDIKAAIEARPARLRLLSGPIVDRTQRPATPARPATKPAKKSRAAAPAASFTGPARTDKD